MGESLSKEFPPVKLFAIDTSRETLVIGVGTTDSQAPYSKLAIDDIDFFYTWFVGDNDSYSNLLYGVMKDSRVMRITSDSFSTRDIEEVAVMLGQLCEKRVYRANTDRSRYIRIT